MKKWLLIIILCPLVGLILFVGFAFLHLQVAKYQIHQGSQALSLSAPLQIGETQKLEILPLYEGNAQSGLESGHGVSYLIRTDNNTILFDLGNNMNATSPSTLEQNMSRLGISLDQVETIVISHRHPDHMGGQNWWIKRTFSPDGTTQPLLGDLPIYVPEILTYPGSNPVVSNMPISLGEGIATTGTIPYAQLFPVWLTAPKGNEQALAVNVTGKGIVLITGCGHMGLKALLERAESIFDVPVVGVIGGLHYGNADAASLQDQILMVKDLNPTVVALSPHDSGPTALDAFAQAFPMAYQAIQVGTAIDIP